MHQYFDPAFDFKCQSQVMMFISHFYFLNWPNHMTIFKWCLQSVEHKYWMIPPPHLDIKWATEATAAVATSFSRTRELAIQIAKKKRIQLNKIKPIERHLSCMLAAGLLLLPCGNNWVRRTSIVVTAAAAEATVIKPREITHTPVGLLV